MSSGGHASDAVVGFLSMVEQDDLGTLGGYLVLNRNGRPLEFHCTAPVKPNRAQEILFGPTLKPYVYGEQMGTALLAKAKAKASLVITDQPAAMTLRGLVKLPVVLIQATAAGEAKPTNISAWQSDPADQRGGPKNLQEQLPRLLHFQRGEQQLAVLAEQSEDEQAVTRQLAFLDEAVNLLEPFERIREALQEAQSGMASSRPNAARSARASA